MTGSSTGRAVRSRAGLVKGHEDLANMRGTVPGLMCRPGENRQGWRKTLSACIGAGANMMFAALVHLGASCL